MHRPLSPSRSAPALALTLLGGSALLGLASSATGCPSREAAEAPPGPLVVRVTGIPDENPTELQRRSQPMVAWLQEALGARVEYVPVTDYGAAVQALAAGKVDFAWLGGFTHVQARHLGEVEPLVMRAIDREFESVFIAHVDSGITSMADLRGKTLAFGSKSSTSGHLMPRHFLGTSFDLDPDRDFDGKPVYSGAHDATAKLVESGRVQAGALNAQVWERVVREGAVDPSRVRLLWTTPPYVDYVWTARRALPRATREAFAAAFLALDAARPQHTQILALQGAERFVPASSEDFDAIEAVARSTGLLR